VSGERKREGGNGLAWGKGRPKGIEEAGWPAWAELPSPFFLSFSFSNSNSNLLNSNKFESNSNHTVK
jgi:hypothetical protein